MSVAGLTEVAKRFIKTLPKKTSTIFVIIALAMLFGMGYGGSIYKKQKHNPTQLINNPENPVQQSNVPDDATTQACFQAVQDYTNSRGTNPIPTCL